MHSIRYRPEIDGLRTIAIIPVILFHLGISWISGGYVGVDVFFVISGYLITSIILKEQQQGKFTFASFWTRRVQRILPVLLLVVFTVLVAGYFFGNRNAYTAQGFQGLSALLSVANVFMWKRVNDYWGPGAESLPFLHCWSLSVEEQFYIFYPALAIWILQKKRQLFYPALILMVGCSLALFAYTYTRKPAAAFYLLPNRMWELGAGCLLALPLSQGLLRLPRWSNYALSALGLVSILVSYVLLPSESVGLKLIFPVLGAMLIVAFAQSKEGIGRLLSLPPVVYVGKISYSLYVWHWPVIVLFRERNPVIMASPVGIPLLLALIVALSVFSYHLIESPLRRSPLTLKIIPAGFAACLLAIGVTELTVNQRGDAYDTSAFNPVAFPSMEYDIKPRETFTGSEKKLFFQIDLGTKPTGRKNGFASNGITKRYGKPNPEVLVIGDSHAIFWAPIIDDVCREQKKTVSFFAKVASFPFIKLPLEPKPVGQLNLNPAEKRQYDLARLEAIKRWKPLVILSVKWSRYRDANSMHDLIQYIGKSGCKLLLIEQPPVLKTGNQNLPQYLSYLGFSPSQPGQRQLFPQAEQDEVIAGQSILRQMVQQYPFCQIIKTYDQYAPDTKNAYIIDGRNLLYIDDDHLSTLGASFSRPRIAQAISSATK